MAMFYNTIIAWSVYYLFVSFKSNLMWKDCNQDWNTPCCLPIKKPNFSNITLSNTEYQQSGSDSFVYRIFQVNSDTVRNRIVMFNTSNSSLNFLKARQQIFHTRNHYTDRSIFFIFFKGSKTRI